MAYGLLIDDLKPVQCVTLTAGAAGASNINGSSVDTAGFDGVLFVVQFGTITAGAATSLKLQQDTVTGFGTAADIAGSGITVLDTNDDTPFAIDIKRPTKQFVRLVILRATQNAVCGAMAFLYRGRSRPTSLSNWTATKRLTSPAEGTP